MAGTPAGPGPGAAQVRRVRRRHFSADADGRRGYASGYPKAGDLYLARRAELDPDTGAFLTDEQGDAVLLPTGLLVRWDEIAVFDITHDPRQGEQP